ncbi:MAG: triose-phosphate isomerase [Gemmatimonadales bacterium]
MSRPLIFAANWKMQIGPAEARDFLRQFLDGFAPADGRSYWFFPPAVSVEAAAGATAGQRAVAVGVQDVYWEPKGAFTGATSVPLARAAGARLVLVGHSERRHVFGETDQDTARKVEAVLAGGLDALLCVGETLAQREAGETERVVVSQLINGLDRVAGTDLGRVTVAYEPVWAIGTGKNATPEDAAAVHRTLRGVLSAKGHPSARILYGGSVNQGNVAALLRQAEIDGVLVGGASLDPAGWRTIVAAAV